MARFLPFLLLACINAANASSLTTAYCAVGSNIQSVSGAAASACGIPTGSPEVYANASGSEAFTLFSGNISTSAAATAASTTFPPMTQYHADATASTGSIQIETPGPVRQGLVRFDIELTNLHAGSASATITDGVHQYSLQSTPGGCQLHACSDAATMPITLGSLLYVSSDSDIYLSGNFALNNFASGGGMADVKLSLFEANGVTPVEMFAVPEPSSIALLLTAGIFFALLIRRHRPV